MIRIDQDALYSRKDLEEMLQGARLDHDTFIGRLKPRKVFRAFYLGSDILEALRAAPALRDDDQDKATASARPQRSKPGRRSSSEPGSKLAAAFGLSNKRGQHE